MRSQKRSRLKWKRKITRMSFKEERRKKKRRKYSIYLMGRAGSPQLLNRRRAVLFRERM
jgi:hypothetical protein